ncbi:MAG TPA: ATP synthase F1 subunit delta [Nitrospiria bacterium]|nr:ATP synthase F1 subunit delta [Nitrospiria bacterium]
MKGSIVKAYAQDLLPLADAEGILERVKDELCYLRELLISIPRLKDFLNNPSISKDSKKGIISELLNNNLSPVTRNHLSLVIDEDRQGLLIDIIGEFCRLVRKTEKVQVLVTSSAPLPDETTKRLLRELSLALGKDLELNLAVDDSILGGVILRIGDRIVDGSISGRLRRLGEHLKQGI